MTYGCRISNIRMDSEVQDEKRTDMSVHIIYVQTINPFIFSLILDIVFIQQSYSVTRWTAGTE